MRLIRSTDEGLEFHLTRWEKLMLAAILSRYPCLPTGYQPLSKGGQAPDAEANQRLLDESLAEHRRDNRRQLEQMLADRARLREEETGWRLVLPAGDVEWLLQVLNEVRVGSWVRLGSPEEPFKLSSEKVAPETAVLAVADRFLAQFLEALESPGT